MSPDYSQCSTDELLQKFVDLARCIGKRRPGDDFKPILAGPEFPGIVGELRKRNPADRIRELYYDDDPGVRQFAGAFLPRVDWDVAIAALQSVAYDLTTREVLAWRDRIRRGPPKRPTLQEMTVPQLVSRFVDACERCYGTRRFLADEKTGGPNVKGYNKCSSEISSAARELHARGQLSALVPLMDHPFITVRQKAGLFCLDIAGEKAVATLEAVSASNQLPESSIAGITLSRWRSGRLRPLD
jgi:hypothetical protein